MATKSLKRQVADSPEREKAEAILADVSNSAALEATANSEGGKILIESLTADALADIDALTGGYKKLPHVELMALCASLEKNLDTIRALKRAGTNKKLAREALAELLAE